MAVLVAFLVAVKNLTKAAGGRVSFGSQFEGAIRQDRKPQWLELKATGFILSTVQMQRETNDSMHVALVSVVTLDPVR